MRQLDLHFPGILTIQSKFWARCQESAFKTDTSREVLHPKEGLRMTEAY